MVNQIRQIPLGLLEILNAILFLPAPDVFQHLSRTDSLHAFEAFRSSVDCVDVPHYRVRAGREEGGESDAGNARRRYGRYDVISLSLNSKIRAPKRSADFFCGHRYHAKNDRLPNVGEAVCVRSEEVLIRGYPAQPST